MENPEEVLSWLEEAARRRPATIPRELDEYLAWVARTGEPVYSWNLVRPLLKEKLLQVLQDFRSQGPPPPTCSRNVPPFDPEAMRNVALARLDTFLAPPFTIQRICELLAHPRRHYNRLDKFMRAFEKNVLVVSTKEPEPPRRPAPASTPTAPAPTSAYENDNDNDAEMDEPSYPRTLNGPLLRRHDASSSAEEQNRSENNMSPTNQIESEDAQSETPTRNEKSEDSLPEEKTPEDFSPSSNHDSSDYKDAYEQISPGEDTPPPQSTEDRIAGAADSLAQFSSTADEDAPITNDDGDNASDIKSEDEIHHMDKPASPLDVEEKVTPVEDSPKVPENVQNIDECAQDDMKDSEEINVDHIESDSTSSPLSGAESDSCPTQARSDESSEPSFENMIEKSSPTPIVTEDTTPNTDSPNEDITENVDEESMNITEVVPEKQTTEPTPMDCTEEETDSPIQTPIENVISDSEEKMVAENNILTPPLETVVQE